MREYKVRELYLPKGANMAKLLHIIASPRPESYSTRVADAFVAAYRETHPQDEVEKLDLFQAPIPDFLAPQAKAKYAVMQGRRPAGADETAWAKVIETIEYFKRFDKYVISSGMWNFGVPYRLKQYIDVIVQPGMTFAFSPEKGYSGLVNGKPLAMILAAGGVYQPGNPAETFDFLEPYLRGVFGFIGFTKVDVIRIQGTLQNPSRQVEADIQAAIAAAVEAARRF
jgi:FMN-dependent NADH-azoreductase